MKACIFKAYDHACASHQENFMKLWNDFMGSMFQSPLMLLKSSSMVRITDESTYTEEVAPTFESTKDRIMEERQQRGAISKAIRSKMKDIPEDDFVADTCTTLVQEIIEETFSAIRCVVADQMQLYSESFFLLPMLRRLEGTMANLELEEEDQQRYRVRMTVLQEEQAISEGINRELIWSIEAIEKFKVTCLE